MAEDTVGTLLLASDRDLRTSGEEVGAKQAPEKDASILLCLLGVLGALGVPFFRRQLGETFIK